MESNIKNLDVAIEICEEIRDKNINNADFDTDYFWNEINCRESNGEEFIDFGNIDITSFKSKKHIKIVISILIALFFIGIVYSFACNFAFIINDNEDYKRILPEIKTADTIDTVKIDNVNNLIYVFYSQASCINTYDFNGDFKWAVSVPYVKDRGISYFYLEDNLIYIDNKGEVYIYDSLSGEFVRKDYAEELGLVEKRDKFDELHEADIKKAKEKGITFDIYNVYLENNDGSVKRYIVNKPFYVILQSDLIGFLISLISAFGISVVAFTNKVRLLRKIEINKNDIRISAKINRCFYIGVLMLYLIFGVSNFVISCINLSNISVGIFPATALLIISLVLNDITKKHYNESEQKYVASVMHYLIVAYVILLISVIISVTIF